MSRNGFTERKSRAEKVFAESDPKSVALRESENALRQYDFVNQTIEDAIKPDGQFKVRPSLLQKLNRFAVEGLTEIPGSFRPGRIEIENSSHQPPLPQQVPELVEEMCDYLNDNWNKTAWHLAAYAMWRLNWIHPFQDGNGRTSRALSYSILCIRLREKIPGSKTIPEQIAGDKKPYYEALEAADAAAEKKIIDVKVLEGLLKSALAAQLYDFHNELAARG